MVALLHQGCFIVILLFYIERKWLSTRNLGSVSMLEIKLSKYWNIVEFPRISNKMKNSKNILRSPNSETIKEITQHTTR